MRVSVGVLMLGAMASCYGTPRSTFPDGGPGIGGAAGSVSDDAGGADAPPVACDAGSSCPTGTVCGPASLCVSCAEITTTLPAAPALRRPMRGAYTGSPHAPAAIATLRPTFTWTAVAPTCGALSYQFQADDSCTPGALDTCTFPTPELDASAITTTSYAPPADLKVSTTPPVGAFYAWRVRACDASARCGLWSEVRYLHVGRVREDINGDGYGDLLALSNRGIEVYLGSSQFDVSAPSNTVPYLSTFPPAFAGDVNGDGYGDLFGMNSYLPSGGYAPTIFYGASEVTAISTLSLTKTAGGPSTLMQTTSAGDMNGDGFSDLIVQWGYGLTTPQTELRIFFGGTTIANTPNLSIAGPYVDFYTLQDSGRVGDVNGDGFEDIALAAMSDGGANGGLVQLFTGGPNPSLTPVNIATTTQIHQIQPAGDVDRDGFDDVLIIVVGSHYALYEGGATLPTTAAMTWTDSTAASGAGGFDFDRDGLSDFVIGTTANAPILYRGGAAAPTLVPSGLSRLTASTKVTFSDHDGDGRPDFIGVTGSTSDAGIQWAGSDGTSDPRTFTVRLPAGVMFSGRLAR